MDSATIRISFFEADAIATGGENKLVTGMLWVQLIRSKFKAAGVDLDGPANGYLHIVETVSSADPIEITWVRDPKEQVNLDDKKTVKALGTMIEKIVADQIKAQEARMQDRPRRVYGS